MVWSIYNRLFETIDARYFLYNSYTNNFIQLSFDDFCLMKECQKNGVGVLDDETKNLLKSECIIVDDDNDIYNKIKLQRYLGRFDKSYLSLTIAPTTGCNFKCYYCYEAGIEGSTNNMSLETAANIICFIKEFKTTQKLRITWYGGEPLLKFNIIEYLTCELKKIIKDYQAHMITNGYLLTPDISAKLQKMDIRGLQITIDGMKDTHNLRRPHKVHNNSFETIIHNLDNLFDIYPQVNVALRVNIDNSNSDEYHSLYEFLSVRYNKYKINIHPGYVTDEFSETKLKPCMGKEDKISFMVKQYTEYKIPMSFYPKTEFGECCARHLMSFVIGPKGEIYKCWNDIGIKEKTIGSVNNYSISNNLCVKYLVDADPLSSDECKKCFYFPICNGGCPYNRINSTKENNSTTCKIIKENLEKFLFYHFQIKQNVTNDIL